MALRIDKSPPTIFTRDRAYKLATQLNADEWDHAGKWVYKVVYVYNGAFIEAYDDNDEFIGTF